MHIINRLITALFSLALAAASLLTIGLATGSISPDRLQILDRARDTLVKLPLLGSTTIATVLLIAVGALLFAGLLLIAQFKRGPQSGYLVREDDTGTFTVQPDAVVDIAAFVGKTISGIESVACTSKQTQDGDLDVRCKVFFRPGVALAKTGDLFKGEFQKQLEELTGLKVRKLDQVAVYRAGRPGREKRRHLV
jgi:hypothetical protein